MKTENQLLARIVRAVTGKPVVEAEAPEAVVEAVAPAEVVEAVVEAVEAAATVAGVEAVAEQVVETLTLAVDASAIQAELASVQEQLTGLVSALTEMTAKYEGAHAALTALTAEKELLLAAQAAAKMTARMGKIEAAIGTEKAAGLMAATEGLEDAAFEAVVSALAGSVDAEAKTGMFQEVGATGQPDAAKIVEESAEMKILKQKYGAK